MNSYLIWKTNSEQQTPNSGERSIFVCVGVNFNLSALAYARERTPGLRRVSAKGLRQFTSQRALGEDFRLPATETYFSVACERICKANGAELCSPTLRLMLIMRRHRLAYCEVMPLWLSQGKTVVVVRRYGQPQRVRVMDAYCCAATQSRWLGSRWSHFNCVWSYCRHKMKAVTVNVR